MAGNVVLTALQQVWTTLSALNVPMAVMGGIALAVWEHVRATQDVDLLIGVEHQKADGLLGVLRRAGFAARRQPPLLTLGDMRLLQLLYTPPGRFVEVRVDLLLADSEFHRQALARRVPARLPGADVDVSVLACEDLVLYKLLAGRIVDRADCIALLTANRASLDPRYLVEWAGRLGVLPALNESWSAAFPGETPHA